MKPFICVFALVAMTALGTPAIAQSEAATVPDKIGAVASETRTEIGKALNQFMSDEGDKLLLLPHRLDKNKLDYSLESLKEIDKWLNAIHTINRIEAGEGRVGDLFTMDGRGDNSVTFAGLYLGEVIRQNASHNWVWQPFEVFVVKNPAHAEYFGDEAGFDTYILVSEQGAATPLNAALKRVMNGSIDSVHYIGSFLMHPIDMDVALSGKDHTGLSATGPVPNGTFLGAPDADPDAVFDKLKAIESSS